MTAIVGLIGRPSLAAAVVDQALGAMSGRGGDRSGRWTTPAGHPPAALGVARAEWESGTGFAGPVLVVAQGDLAVAADASLFHLEDLRRALDGVGARVVDGSTPSHYILAAYRAWGARCAERLEGDFAFVLWDGATRRLVAARDFGGKRPLFYAHAGAALTVASSIGGVLATLGARPPLDLAAVAADAAGLFAADSATCYQGISRFAAGQTLVYANGDVHMAPHWQPAPAATAAPHRSFNDAALELRALLERATAERAGPHGTSLWLSGGWDSTAVLGASESAFARAGRNEHLRAVSISYPPGDPGREDELITAAAGRWSTPVHWLLADQIALVDGPDRAAARRDEPFAHAFDGTTHALARGSRAVDTRVAFDGSGGDQLFQASPVYLADLLRTGRWATLRREWLERRLRGRRTFFRYAVEPMLPPVALQLASWLRGGRPLVSHGASALPPWLRPAFARQAGLLERDRAAAPPRAGRGAFEREAGCQLAYPFFPRVSSVVAEAALADGVDLRSPLLDRRVVEFALARPREDRAQGAETKRLLRAAMRGLLPETILAPRPRRTGVPGAYLARSLRACGGELEPLIAAPFVTDALGIVDVRLFRDGWARFQLGDDRAPLLHLLLTLNVELWVRAHADAASSA